MIVVVLLLILIALVMPGVLRFGLGLVGLAILYVIFVELPKLPDPPSSPERNIATSQSEITKPAFIFINDTSDAQQLCQSISSGAHIADCKASVLKHMNDIMINVPVYDFRKGCSIWEDIEKEASGGGCIQLEIDSFNALNAVWPTLPNWVKKVCVEMNIENLIDSREASTNPKSKYQDSFFYPFLESCTRMSMRKMLQTEVPLSFQR